MEITTFKEFAEIAMELDTDQRGLLAARIEALANNGCSLEGLPGGATSLVDLVFLKLPTIVERHPDIVPASVEGLVGSLRSETQVSCLVKALQLQMLHARCLKLTANFH